MTQRSGNGTGSTRVRGGGSYAGRVRARRGVIGLMLMLPYITGCYSYVPAGEVTPAVGREVQVALSDRGRVDVADRLGPRVLNLKGFVLENSDTSVVVSVRSVAYIDRNHPVEWNGQWIELSSGLVNEVRERRFSRKRTLLAAGLVAALGVISVTMDIVGFGLDGGSDRPDDGGEGPGQS